MNNFDVRKSRFVPIRIYENRNKVYSLTIERIGVTSNQVNKSMLEFIGDSSEYS